MDDKKFKFFLAIFLCETKQIRCKKRLFDSSNSCDENFKLLKSNFKSEQNWKKTLQRAVQTIIWRNVSCFLTQIGSQKNWNLLGKLRNFDLFQIASGKVPNGAKNFFWSYSIQVMKIWDSLKYFIDRIGSRKIPVFLEQANQIKSQQI